ncbi:MAG TPA: hypothetical protein VNX18_14795 [Bryobacteraceae bacterium]|jgi:hypothetical protein|nr:hypothetical protein [Bryobacteraceae bacterium]
MTRRTAILIGCGIPVWAATGRPFWDEKDPQSWTDDERQELLTKSPWARPATVHNDPGFGGLTGRGSTTSNTSRRGGRTPAVAAPQDPMITGKYQALVRWDSALPIREANRNQSKDDPAANYILSVNGDLPMIGRRSNDESESEFAQRLEMLKQYTKLEKRGDPIFLNKIAYSNTGTLFYFERNDLIRLDDHQVTFVTKLGPIDVKAKFPLKEMLYRGKLDL